MGNPMLDIFNDDAFSVTSLTDAVQDMKVRSSRINDMGLFTEGGVSALTIAIERMGDTIQIVAPTPRGAPGDTKEVSKRNMTAIAVPHFQRDWSVMADEVQGVREFGSENNLQTVMGVVAAKLADNVADLDLTDEYSRLGAIQGVVTYKGGSTLDLYNTFGITAPSAITFDMSVDDGSLRQQCSNMIRSARKAVGALSFDHIHAFVGDDFFDALLKSPEVRSTFTGWTDAQILRDSYTGATRAENPIFEFGGIVWENYGAIDDDGDGALVGIGAKKARFFPFGMPGLFRTYHAPADYMETVNTIGLRRYAKQWPMVNGKGINGETQTNVLHICTRPNVLLSGAIS